MQLNGLDAINSSLAFFEPWREWTVALSDADFGALWRRWRHSAGVSVGLGNLWTRAMPAVVAADSVVGEDCLRGLQLVLKYRMEGGYTEHAWKENKTAMFFV